MTEDKVSCLAYGLSYSLSERLTKLNIKNEISGAIRRGINSIKSVDFVVDYLEGAWLAVFGGTPQDLRNKRFVTGQLNNIPIRFNLAFPEEWGAMLLATTGNNFFTIQLRSHAKQEGLRLNQYGLWHFQTLIAGIREDQIFDALGLPWIPPQEREYTRGQKLPKGG
jgi:DNA polymerase (family 10)